MTIKYTVEEARKGLEDLLHDQEIHALANRVLQDKTHIPLVEYGSKIIKSETEAENEAMEKYKLIKQNETFPYDASGSAVFRTFRRLEYVTGTTPVVYEVDMEEESRVYDHVFDKMESYANKARFKNSKKYNPIQDPQDLDLNAIACEMERHLNIPVLEAIRDELGRGLTHRANEIVRKKYNVDYFGNLSNALNKASNMIFGKADFPFPESLEKTVTVQGLKEFENKHQTFVNNLGFLIDIAKKRKIEARNEEVRPYGDNPIYNEGGRFSYDKTIYLPWMNKEDYQRLYEDHFAAEYFNQRITEILFGEEKQDVKKELAVKGLLGAMGLGGAIAGLLLLRACQ